jgi:hypothetical protein
MRSRRTARAAALLLAAAGASCTMLRSIWTSDAPAPRPFNHEAHIVRGPSCADCHEKAEKEASAGMPSRDFCMNCHEDLDKDPNKPVEKKVAWFLNEKGEPGWSAFTKQSPEIRFSHATHAAKGVACVACHEGIDKDTGLVSGKVQRMASCTACHAEKAAAKTGCATCHTVQNRLVPPRNHGQLWGSLHGSAARLGGAISTANACSLCHAGDACTTCHQTRPPADHTEAWRQRPHGIAAGVDRQRCTTCHTSDGCVRCHQETVPASHGPAWGGAASRHCTGCHLPVQASTGCAVCHRSTPGHDGSPAQPAWHTPGSNCRSCHGASLKHPDNGDRCESCHR